MKIKKPSIYLLVYSTLSLIYGLFFAALPLREFPDRIHYLNYATDRSWWLLKVYFSSSFATGMVNEPVWLLLNSLLVSIMGPEVIVRLLIVLSGAIIAFLVLRCTKGNFWWGCFILLTPIVVTNHAIQIRQGLAISVFLLSWLCLSGGYRWVLIFLTPQIHASFFFVVPLAVLPSLLRCLRFAADLRLLMGIAGVFVLSVPAMWIASLAGARQAEVYKGPPDVSGAAFVFWLSVLLVMLMQGTTFIKKYFFTLSGLLLYLVSYWFLPVTARVFENFFVLVMLAVMDLTGWRRLYGMGALLAMVSALYFFRLGMPWLGFGV